MFFFFSSRRRHTRSLRDWSSDVCSSDLQKEGKTIRHIILEAASGAIADAGIEAGEIQTGVIGNFASGLFTKQLHLGAFLTEIDDKLRGLPTLHVEAACASGGVAVLTAGQQIMGGLRDVE